MCVFEGVGIDLGAGTAEEFHTEATARGIGFPLHRGVQSSLKGVLEKTGAGEAVMEYASGLDHCREKLSQMKKGTLKAAYFEGMACQNGCIDGPGALAQFGLARVMLEKFAESAEKKTSDESPEARRLAEAIQKQTMV